MNSSAMILMAVVQLTVIAVTGYFFYLVLTLPKKSEPDSYSENDDEE